MSETNKQPAARVRLATLQASIWRNQTPDGKVYYSATFDRRYADKDGTWKNSSNFSTDELLLLAKIADLAHTEIMKLRSADRAAGPGEETEPAAA
jgi:hypothetical protein